MVHFSIGRIDPFLALTDTLPAAHLAAVQAKEYIIDAIALVAPETVMLGESDKFLELIDHLPGKLPVSGFRRGK